MTFPGYPLATAFTNASAQSTVHPAHHEALENAVNDLQGQVTALDAEVTAITASYVALGDPGAVSAIISGGVTRIPLATGNYTVILTDVLLQNTKGSAWTNSIEVIATIPAGYRPAVVPGSSMLHDVTSGAAPGTHAPQTNGNILMGGGTVNNNDFVRLYGSWTT